MIRSLLSFACFTTFAVLSQAAPPKPKAADWIVGVWEPLPQAKAPGDHLACEFFRDGKIRAGSGKARRAGTYSLSEDDKAITLTITWERNGKQLSIETAILCFRGENRLVWYPDGEWKGIVLKRKLR